MPSKEELEVYTLGSLRKAVFDGNVKEGSLMAGQVAGQLHEIRPAAEILEELYTSFCELKKDLAKDCDELMKIRDRELSIPIIQGGMGVGISLSGLAGAVGCGGMGASLPPIPVTGPRFLPRPFAGQPALPLRRRSPEPRRSPEAAVW